MLPLTLLAAQKLSDLLTTNNTLQQTIFNLAQAAGASVPPLASNQIVLTSAAREIGDREISFSYPRIGIYSSQIKNMQWEKFRSFSGSILVAAEIWSSSN